MIFPRRHVSIPGRNTIFNTYDSNSAQFPDAESKHKRSQKPAVRGINNYVLIMYAEILKIRIRPIDYSVKDYFV